MSNVLSLSKQLLLQVAPVSSFSSLHVLPPGSNKTQRILIGDDSGTVQCLSLRRGAAPEVEFKTVVADGRIECIALGSSGLGAVSPAVAGGTTATALAARERMFVSAGGTVRGLNKKGKEFFCLNTNLAESLRFMMIEGPHIYAASDYAFQHYEDGADAHFVVSPNRISCLVADRVATAVGPGFDVLLGCTDGAVRLVLDDGRIAQEFPLDDGPLTALVSWEAAASVGAGTPLASTAVVAQGFSWETAAKLLRGATGAGVGGVGAAAQGGLAALATAASPVRFFLYGTSTGCIGMLVGHPSVSGVRKLWSFRGADPLGITSLACFDMRGSGVPDVLVGRTGGGLEVYACSLAGGGEGKGVGPGFGESLGASDAAVGTPVGLRRVWSTSVEESVRAVVGGHLTSQGVPELLALTFSGRLYSFTSERMDERNGEDSAGRSKAVVSRSVAVAGLRKEVEDLRRKAEALAVSAQSSPSPSSSSGPPMLFPHHDASVSWALDPSDGAYVLTVELPCALEAVLISSSVHLDVPGLMRAEGGECDGPSSSGSDDLLYSVGAEGMGGYVFGVGASTRPGAPPPTNAILSTSPIDTVSARLAGHVPPTVLLTARLAERGSRCTVRLRAVEGCAGEVVACVCGAAQGVASGKQHVTAPPASACTVRLPIRPLSLHTRCLEGSAAVEGKVAEQWAAWLAGHAKRHRDGEGREARGAGPSSEEGGEGDGLAPGTGDGLGESASDTSRAAQYLRIAGNMKAARAALGPPQPSPMEALPPSRLPATFPWCTLTLTGPFTLAMAHEWVGGLLQDVPPRTAAVAATASAASGSDPSIALAYRHVLVGSHLLISYTAGRATVRSDNVSALTMMRDGLASAATASRIRVDMKLELACEQSAAQPGMAGEPPPPSHPHSLTLRHVLALLHSRLTYVLAVAFRAQLADAVREMVQSEPGVGAGEVDPSADASTLSAAYPFLHPLWAEVLGRGTEYKRAAGAQPRLVARLAGLLTDLWVDYQRCAYGRDLSGPESAAGSANMTALLSKYGRDGGPGALLAFMQR